MPNGIALYICIHRYKYIYKIHRVKKIIIYHVIYKMCAQCRYNKIQCIMIDNMYIYILLIITNIIYTCIHIANRLIFKSKYTNTI